MTETEGCANPPPNTSRSVRRKMGIAESRALSMVAKEVLT